MGASILVVDDEPAIQQLLRTVLKLDGHDVHTADTADDALKELRKSPAELIILDLIMPGMPPRDFVKRVRSESDVPILVLSGDHAGLEIGLLIGADDAMEKPFEPDELLERIGRLLNGGAVPVNVNAP